MQRNIVDYVKSKVDFENKSVGIENSNADFYTGSAKLPTSNVLPIPKSKCTIMIRVFTTRLPKILTAHFEKVCAKPRVLVDLLQNEVDLKLLFCHTI